MLLGLKQNTTRNVVVNKEEQNEQLVFTSVGEILSKQAHYRIKACRNEDTATVILLRG